MFTYVMVYQRVTVKVDFYKTKLIKRAIYITCYNSGHAKAN